MKYIKHYYIDPVTGTPYSNPGNVGVNGKSHPPLENLDVKFWFKNADGTDYCLSVVPPETNTTSIPGVENLTETEWFDDAEAQYTKRKDGRINEVFVLVQNIKKEVIDKWWHHSEITAAMTIKVAEAEAAVAAVDEAAARTVAPFLTVEADARQITVKDLAARVLANYTGLIQGEAIVSGHRGLLTDQITALTFDRTDIATAVSSFVALNDFDITQGFDAIRTQLGL